jgi:RNA polymerase sigma-70 factor, ECF subfamily
MDMMAAGSASGPVDPPDLEGAWIGPINDRRVLPANGDPAEAAETRESVRLAFVAALQHLPARQRAVLILREVLKWKASEVAELLDTTVVSVNSALQRARATLSDHDVTSESPVEPIDAEQEALLARYIDAFERFDIDELVSLLHEDATMQMPPYAMWLRGAEEYRTWLLGAGAGCEGSRIVRVEANGAPAYAQWRRNPDGSGYHAWSIHIVRLSGERITWMDFFVDPRLFAQFELPVTLDN